MSATPESPTNGGIAQKALDSSFVIVAVSQGHPTFSAKVPRRKGTGGKDVEIQVDGATIDAEAAAVAGTVVDLLPKAQRNRLNAAYAAVQKFVRDENVTLPHPTLSMLRILPAARQAAFFAELPHVERQFHDAVDAVFEDYEPVIVPYAREVIDRFFGGADAAKARARHLPPLSILRPRFFIKVVRGSFQFDDATDAASAVRKLSEDLRDRIESSLTAVAERLRTGKVLTTRTFTELTNALATAKAFGDVLGGDVVAKAGDLESRLTKVFDVAAVRGSGTSISDVIRSQRGAIDGAIGAVLDVVGDQDAADRVLARFGAAPRRISEDD